MSVNRVPQYHTMINLANEKINASDRPVCEKIFHLYLKYERNDFAFSREIKKIFRDDFSRFEKIISNFHSESIPSNQSNAIEVYNFLNTLHRNLQVIAGHSHMDQAEDTVDESDVTVNEFSADALELTEGYTGFPYAPSQSFLFTKP